MKKKKRLTKVTKYLLKYELIKSLFDVARILLKNKNSN